jgi:hypothetical protein
MRKLSCLPIAAAVLLAGCVATVPTGPSVMVFPGSGKDFDEFRYDDAVCRQWALQQVGTTTAQASSDAAVGSAVVGTVVGAAAGAAIGAASGHPAEGAAIGSGIGLLGGSAVGADRAAGAHYTVQRRYDIAYMQCMYAKGNQVPMRGGAQRPPARYGAPSSPPPSLPPPPVGSPPPPPPGAGW